MEQNKSVVQTSNQNVMPVAFNFFDPVQFETMQRVSKMFASSDLVPDSYKPVLKMIPAGANEGQIAAIQQENAAAQNKAIANCMIALEVANRIGASPLMVMQNLVVIYGRPSWSAKFLIATVNTCGRFEPLQFKFIKNGNLGKVEYTDYVWNQSAHRKEAQKKEFDGTNVEDLVCVAFTKKKGSDDVLESSPISIRMAIQEGWYMKSGSKWQTMPKQMLMYRAASWWTSVYAPEISMGMRTVEENQEIHELRENIDYTDVTEEVRQEKDANANKTAIGFDQGAPEGDNPGTMGVVDTETGEIKDAGYSGDAAGTGEDAAAGNQPEGENKEDNPGF